MLNNIIRASFAIIGAITGFTLTKTFFYVQGIEVNPSLKIIIFAAVSLVAAGIFFFLSNKIIELATSIADRIESAIQKMTLYELTISALGLIIGLVIANLIVIPITKVDIIGVPVSVMINVLFALTGVVIANAKKNEVIFESIREKKNRNAGNHHSGEPKLLDTSVIIDGRIADICRVGFMEGELIVPDFVLEELRHIADSQDLLKRNRGRRGLDVLNILQKELNYPVRIENMDIRDAAEVDDKLLEAAKILGCSVITIDYNLSKVASFQGVKVLNINELTNAVKPIALPGEDLVVQVIKDGKENGQGIGYLEDGTMIVVEGGRRYMGESVSVTVTSVLQTAAGRMIFARPKFQMERVI